MDRLREIGVPVLFTAGQYDEAPSSTLEYYQSKLPGSEVAIFEGASHSHHIEQTAEFLRVVSDFLRREERR